MNKKQYLKQQIKILKEDITVFNEEDDIFELKELEKELSLLNN